MEGGRKEERRRGKEVGEIETRYRGSMVAFVDMGWATNKGGVCANTWTFACPVCFVCLFYVYLLRVFPFPSP